MKEMFFAGKSYHSDAFIGPYFALLKITEGDFEKLESMLKLKKLGEANYLENCGIVSPYIGELTIFEHPPKEIEDFDNTLSITESEYLSMFKECSGDDDYGIVRLEWASYAKTQVHKGMDFFYFFSYGKWDGLLLEVGPISIGELREKFKE